MIGVDITIISRFEGKSFFFVRRVLHPLELKAYYKCKNKAYFLATRWSIKEAMFKANNSFFAFNKIYVEQSSVGFRHKNFHISTTASGKQVMAIVKETK